MSDAQPRHSKPLFGPAQMGGQEVELSVEPFGLERAPVVWLCLRDDYEAQAVSVSLTCEEARSLAAKLIEGAEAVELSAALA